MIEGHGDDAYRFDGITSDFSSNICANVDHAILMDHLASLPRLLCHYPEPEPWSLEKLIAEYHGIDPQQVIVTNGATDAIYLIAQAFRLRPDIPSPTFSEYRDACLMFPPASQSGDTTSAGTIHWLCNPNNPTGQVLAQPEIDKMTLSGDIVVIDQSYEHYTDQEIMTPRMAAENPQFIQIHSFTKTYAVPGLRLGYITAHCHLTGILRRFLRPWSVSALAVEAGKFLLQHDELVCRPHLAEARRLADGLRQIRGVEVKPTQTNFMLCHLLQGTAHALKTFLIEHHKMLIRDASNFDGLDDRYFRVAAQSPQENDALIAAVRGFCMSQTSSPSTKPDKHDE